MTDGGQYADMEESIVFPCDLVQWTSISIQLAALVSVKNPNRLISKLQEVQEQIPVSPDGASTSTRANAFNGLAKFLFEEASEEEQDVFFNKTFPCIIHWSLKIEQLRPIRGLRYSRQHNFGQTIISRQLVASILACAFLSIFPYKRSKDALVNVINFDGFFSHPTSGGQYAKLRCILHYYERLADLPDGPHGNLVFTRKGLDKNVLPELDDWCSHCQLLCPLHVHPRGLIMDAPPSVMQIHVSNRKYGGSVLGAGQTQLALQEELRLCQSPELLVGMLFIESMAENEAIWVQGHEIFSMCSGHAHSLKFTGDFRDPARPLPNGELPSLLCCIDPLSKAARFQYEGSCVLRELNKIYAGFFCPDSLANSISLTGELQPVSESNSQAVCQFAEAFSEAILIAAVKDVCFPYQDLPLPRPSPSTSSSYVSSGSSSGSGSSGGSDGYHSHRSWTKDSSFHRSDSESSHDGHAPYDMDRSWLMTMRRRSSNFSDVSSRRSSDLASRRSSSSTRHSSDFSSEFEDYFETFQRQELRRQHAVIKEETSGTAVQDFIGSMVSDLMKEGSNLAAQMAPGVQDFAAYQPPHVARPTPVKPQPSNASPSSTSSAATSNQTDDQKLQGNIVSYVEHLLTTSLQNVQEQTDTERAQRLEEPGAVGGVDIDAPRVGWEGLRPPSTSSIGRSSSNSDVGGSPALSSHSGESLTDDLKQAVAESVRAWPRRNQHTESYLDNIDDYHINIPVNTEAAVQTEPHVEVPQGRKSLHTRDHRSRSHRSASLGSALTYRRLSEGFLQERTEEMYGYAEDVVMSSIQNAVEEVYGYKEIPVSFTRPSHQEKLLSRSLPSRHGNSRKGSMDDTLSSFATHLARRCSLDDLNKSRRRSSGFRDVTLSNFEDELKRSNPRLELFEPLSHRQGSISSIGSSTNSRRQSSDFLLFGSSRDGGSNSLKGERDSPLCKAILLDFLSTSTSIDSQSTKYSRTSNLEWFAQDLLLESFNDAFAEMYGKDYADELEQLIMERCEEESEVSVSTESCTDSLRPNVPLESYVENMVNTAMQDALFIITQQPHLHLPHPRPQRSRRSWSVETGEEDVESLYEDAIDIPYELADRVAVTMASNIMEAVKTDIVKKAKDRQILQDEYYQRRRRWRRKQRFPGVGHPRAVATGNWGCGALGGDPQLKMLLQWVAASVAHVPVLHYYTCSDDALSQVRQVCKRIIKEGWSSADLLEHVLHACQRQLNHYGPTPPPAIFDLIFEDS